MKVQFLLAIVPFFSTVLAGPQESWDDICEPEQHIAETIIEGQKFKYTCRYQHVGAATKQSGNYNHPDDCARLIINEPNTVVSWTGKGGACYKAAGPGTKPGSPTTKILAMEKADDDLVEEEDELEMCQSALKKAQDDLETCKNTNQNQNPDPVPDPNQNTTPSCGGTHQQGSKNWKVTCNKVGLGTMLRPVHTTNDLQQCIDKCLAAQSKGCRIAAKLAQASNNCVLYSGGTTKWNSKDGAQTAEMQ